MVFFQNSKRVCVCVCVWGGGGGEGGVDKETCKWKIPGVGDPM